MPLSEHVYCMGIAFKMTEYSNKSASNFVLSLNILHRGNVGESEGHSYGQLVMGSFIVTTCCLCTASPESFFGKYQITQVTQASYCPDLESCDIWLFPKLESPLKGKRFQTLDEIQQNTMQQLMVAGRTV